MKTISIILPVYNLEQPLTKCLSSLNSQSIRNKLDVIMIDDGSTDGSPNIMKQFEKTYADVFRYFRIENSGVSVARNLGLKLAECEFIGFVDGDDYCDSLMFEKLLSKAEMSSSDIVVCGRNTLTLDRRGEVVEIIASDYAEYENDFGYSMFEKRNLLARITNALWDKIYAKKLFEDFTFPVGYRATDMYAITILLTKAKKVELINEPLYFYIRGRNDSITNKNLNMVVNTKVRQMVIDFYKEKNLFDLFKEQLQWKNIRDYLYRDSNYFKYSTNFKKISDYSNLMYNNLDDYGKRWQKNSYFLDFCKYSQKGWLYKLVYSNKQVLLLVHAILCFINFLTKPKKYLSNKN